MHEVGVAYRDIRHADGGVAAKLGAYGSAAVVPAVLLREPQRKAGRKYID